MTKKFKQKIDKIRTRGALTPSSKFLVYKVINKIDFNQDITILQLGYGRGVFTKKIIKHLTPNSRVIIFEVDEKCRKHIIDDPRVTYIEDSAENISEYFSGAQFDHIISTLPFTTIPKSITRRIHEQIKLHIKENGKFLQYQYSLHSKGDISRLFDQKPNIEFTFLNFPPAFIYETQNIREETFA